MKYAYIDNGIVQEIVENDPRKLFSASYAAQFIEVADNVQQGWVVNNGEFSAPPVVVQIPQSVTMRQARLALLAAGKLDQVDATLAAMPEGVAKRAALIEWEYSSEVWRNKELVRTLGPALGLDDAALDSMFITAAAL